MIHQKTILIFLLVLLLTDAFGAHGSYGSDVFEWLGIIVGIFFLWGLIKIIRNGNAQEIESEIEDDLIDHFIEKKSPNE